MFAATPARADWLDDLGATLTRDPSEKVRAQAALTLGKSHDARAVPLLVHALDDDAETVRGYAVQALGLSGDRRAIGPLERLRSDASPFVRESVEKVLPKLRALPEGRTSAGGPAAPTPLAPPPRNARFFFTVRFTVKGGSATDERVLADRTLRALSRLPRVTVRLAGVAEATARGGRRRRGGRGSPQATQSPAGSVAVELVAPSAPSASTLRKLGLSGYLVDGTLRLSLSTSPPRLECALLGMLATYPARAIRATLDADLTVPGVTRAGDADAVAQCLDGAATVIAGEARKFLAALPDRP